MTDSRDRISGPAPADSADDAESQTFFHDEPPEGASGGRGDLSHVPRQKIGFRQ